MDVKRDFEMRRLFLIFFVSAWAQAQNFQTVSYSGDAETIQGAVQDIEQDATGRMWFLSKRGVATYDGRQWINQDRGLTGKPQDLAIDTKDRRWVLTLSGDYPLWYQEGESNWKSVPAPKGYKEGNSDGCIEVLGGGGRVQVFLSNGLDVYLFRGGVWSEIKFKGEPLHIDSFSKKGNRIYMTGRNGAFIFDGKRLESLTEIIPKSVGRIVELVPNTLDDSIYVIGQTVLGKLIEDRYEELAEFGGMLEGRLSRRACAAPDSHGGVMFGEFGVVLHYNSSGRLQLYTDQSGYSANEIESIFLDRENLIWIGGRGGVKKIVDLRFAHYDQRQGLAVNDVAALYLEENGDVLVGQKQDILRFDGKRFKALNKEPIGAKNSRIFKIIGDGEGGAWAVSYREGLIRIKGDQIIQKPEWRVDRLISLAYGPGASLFVCSERMLFRLEESLLVPVFDKHFNFRVRQMAYRESDGLWLATTDGVVNIQDQQIRQFKASTAEGNNSSAIYLAEDGRVFVGTFDWVYVVEKNRLRKSRLFNDHSRPIYFMKGTLDGLWLGSDNGVFFHDGKELRHFSTADGFIGRDANRGACEIAPDGRVFIGTEKGMAVYEPAFDRQEKVGPLLKLEHIRSGGQNFDPSENLQLEYDRQDVIFSYKAISFADERTLEYQYMLEGYDLEWQSLRGGDQSRYTHLPPGKYRFFVKARSSGSDWTPVISTGLISVLKPIYKRVWFVFLVGVLALVLIYSVIEYFSSKRYSRFLERQVADRTAELSKKTVQLESQIDASKAAEAKVIALNEELEERVAQRSRELEIAHRDLVENAHYEGMAEIANSIIHNVGNILNSISTSGYLIQEKVENSKLQALEKAKMLVAQHKDDLPTFLRDDPKALKLMEFYLSLGDVFQKERETLLYHCRLMLEKVGTIKDVVAQQHNYASGVYQTQVLDPVEIVETSIKIISASWEGQGIEIIKDFEKSPEVAVQKTRFIHTVVNLLKNAKEATLVAPNPVKRIFVRISHHGNEVLIAVRDNGVGIPEENLKRIFNHGFTTKENGHGFGLHSSANAISEMGGNMWAESDGLGTGACFYLSLPVAGSRLSNPKVIAS